MFTLEGFIVLSHYQSILTVLFNNRLLSPNNKAVGGSFILFHNQDGAIEAGEGEEYQLSITCYTIAELKHNPLKMFITPISKLI